MTPIELLRDMRAQHAARHTYRANADRLWDLAFELRKDGWQGWARQVERFAMYAERAAQAER
jgi:hypothetical protein